MKTTTKTFAYFALTCILVASCTGKEEHADQNKTKQPTSTTIYRTVKAEVSNRISDIRTTGRIISNPEATVRYTPLISGTIEQSFFNLGSAVTKGQKLLSVRSSEVNALKAEIESAQQELMITKRDLASMEALYNDGMISQKELFETRAKVKQTESLLHKNKADLAMLGKETSNGVFTITAPISGYILAKNISAGSNISPDSEPLFIVADLADVWAEASVYAAHIQSLQQGQDAIVTTSAYPGEEFKGKVTTISNVFDTEDKALKVRVALSNPKLKLKPEMTVAIHLKNNADQSVVTLPSEAIIFDNNAYWVVCKDHNNIAKVKEVTLAGTNGKFSFIQEGVNEGDEIVIKDQLLIYSALKTN